MEEGGGVVERSRKKKRDGSWPGSNCDGSAPMPLGLLSDDCTWFWQGLELPGAVIGVAR